MEPSLLPAAITAGTALVSLLFLSGIGLFGLAWFAIRESDGPSVGPLVGFLVFAGGWSVTYGIAVQVHEPVTREVMDVVQWFLLAYIPTFWFLFAVEYSGYEEYVTRPRLAALFSVPFITTLMALTNGWHGLMWSDHTVYDAAGLAVTTYTYEPWLIVNLFYAYGLLLAGVLILLRLIVTDEGLYADQALSLLVGMFVPWVANVLVMVRMVPVPGFDYTPFAFAITGLAFSNALFRYRLLQFLPAISTIGRDEALETLEAGVVVLDEARRVVYVNAAARELFGIDDSVTGEDVTDLIDVDAMDVDAPDSLGELQIEDRTLEVRTSEIVDRRSERIGHTVVLTDVTQREHDRRRLERQRDELERLDELNATIRGVNRALVAATSRSEIEEAVCEELAASDLYDAAYAADLVTWHGDARNWTTAGATRDLRLPTVGEDGVETTAEWIVVPIVAERRIEGVLGVYTDRETVADSEFTVLNELGELVGHAVDTAERQRTLATESITEVVLESTDDGSVLAAATQGTDVECTLVGFVPPVENDAVAYLSLDGGTDRTRRRMPADAGDAVEIQSLSTDGSAGMFEWRVTENTLLGTLEALGAQVRKASAVAGVARYTVELPSAEDDLLEQIERAFPDTEMVSRTERERPADLSELVLIDATEELTDRQRDVLEVAYQAGYFAWPRDVTAEQVAEALDITPPTLHAHLRKAEGRIVSRLFEERT